MIKKLYLSTLIRKENISIIILSVLAALFKYYSICLIALFRY